MPFLTHLVKIFPKKKSNITPVPGKLSNVCKEVKLSLKFPESNLQCAIFPVGLMVCAVYRILG